MKATALRVLHLIPKLEGGGAELQLNHLVAAQSESGHDIHVVARFPEPGRARMQRVGATVHALARARYDLRLIADLQSLARKIQPDLIQTWLTPMDILGGSVALLTRSAWIATERSSGKAYPRTWKNRARTALVPRANAIVANSDDGRAYWQSLGVSETKLHVVPNCVVEKEPALTRPLPALSGPAVLFAGRLDPEKNVSVVLHAMQLAARTSDAEFLICGEGPEASLVRTIDTTIANRFHYLGWRNDVDCLLRQAHVFVSLSRFEGCPNAVLEAMANGCPMVLSDIAAHRALVDERSAWLVNVDDAEMAAGAIEHILKNPDEARSRSQEARLLATRFSAGNAAAAYGRIYEQVITHSQLQRTG